MSESNGSLNLKQFLNDNLFGKFKLNFIMIFMLSLGLLFIIKGFAGLTHISEIFIIGFTISGFIIGMSYSLTRNILVPVIVALSYNGVIMFIQSTTLSTSIDYSSFFIDLFASGVIPLFIVFVVVWSVLFIYHIRHYCTKLKFIEKYQTIDLWMFIVGSGVAACLYGLFQVIVI